MALHVVECVAKIWLYAFFSFHHCKCSGDTSLYGRVLGLSLKGFCFPLAHGANIYIYIGAMFKRIIFEKSQKIIFLRYFEKNSDFGDLAH